MDHTTIAAVLQACCSPNAVERQAGEEELKKVSRTAVPVRFFRLAAPK